MFRGGSVFNKDEVLFRIADRHVKILLEKAVMLRARYTMMNEDEIVLRFARELENAAKHIAFDCAVRGLITWDDYRTIRNIIDHIGTGEKMEDIVW